MSSTINNDRIMVPVIIIYVWNTRYANVQVAKALFQSKVTSQKLPQSK